MQAWLTQHADRFRTAPRVAFCQVFVSRDRRGAGAEVDAATLLAQFVKAGTAAGCEALGDARMLPHEIALSEPRDIDRLFGPGFAQQIDPIAPGTRAGPLKSSYGLHLVTVCERSDGELPELGRVRAQVEREFLAAMLLLAAAGPASAHEIRPGCLELREREPGSHALLWKRPTGGEVEIQIAPVVPEGWRLSRHPTGSN